MTQASLQTDDFKVIARVLGHGGYAAWRAPRREGHKGQTVYGLLHCGRWAATLGQLETGIEDADLAKFWAKAIQRMRKMGLNEDERHDVARQLVRKSVPMPEQATWPGAGESHWADVLAELASLIQDSELAA